MIFYFNTETQGAQLDFNLMEDFLSFDSIEGVDKGFIRLARVDDDLRVSMVGGPLDGKSVILLGVAPADLDFNKLSELSGFLMVGDNNADGEDDGNNMLNGTSEGDFFMGLGGNDTISASTGNDVIDMSVGATGGYGRDTIDGDLGTDLVFFGATMTSGVTVNLGTQTVTGGAAGSRAKLISIEDVSGTQFADSITGSSVANRLAGEAGNDTITGAGGNDSLNGGTGTDRLLGGAGNDVLMWGAGDFFNGGAGTDTLKVTGATLNLTSAANTNNKLLDVEQIDLRVGVHTLILNRSDVLDMSPTNQVKILGDEGDTVDISGFTAGATSGGFRTYSLGGGATLLIDVDIHVM